MKTAVSIPDDVFEGAERLAITRRTRKSRNRLFSDAVKEYVSRHSPEEGDVWWADLPPPAGSGPGFRRPVIVVQGDALNRSRIATIVCVQLTSNLRWANAPGNVLLLARFTGLPKDSTANVSQILALDRNLLTERVGHLPRAKLDLLFTGIDVVFGK